MNILFLSFTCEDIGVAMVTNMIIELEFSVIEFFSSSLEFLTFFGTENISIIVFISAL